MTAIYVDATTLIALGTVGELDHLPSFTGDIVVCPGVEEEVTTEPAATNLVRLLDGGTVTTDTPPERFDAQARELLDETETNGDVQVVAAVLAYTAADEPVAVVSDDRRLRTVARGLGAEVTGTNGVLVRAVEEGLAAETARGLVRRTDEHGLHMTAELRTKAIGLIDDAARGDTDPSQ